MKVSAEQLFNMLGAENKEISENMVKEIVDKWPVDEDGNLTNANGERYLDVEEDEICPEYAVDLIVEYVKEHCEKNPISADEICSEYDVDSMEQVKLFYNPAGEGAYIVEYLTGTKMEYSEVYTHSFETKPEAMQDYTETIAGSRIAAVEFDEQIFYNIITDNDEFNRICKQHVEGYDREIIETYLDEEYPDLYKTNEQKYKNYVQCIFNWLYEDCSNNNDCLLSIMKKSIEKIDEKMEEDANYIETC